MCMRKCVLISLDVYVQGGEALALLLSSVSFLLVVINSVTNVTTSTVVIGDLNFGPNYGIDADATVNRKSHTLGIRRLLRL